MSARSSQGKHFAQTSRRVRRPRRRHRILRAFLIIVAILVVAFGGYVLYLEHYYTRIPDSTELTIEGADTVANQQLEVGKTYTATTYNIGFGAYTPDYTFFMDEGYMASGTVSDESAGTGSETTESAAAGSEAIAVTTKATKTKGEHGTAVSKESVLDCTNGAIGVIEDVNPDFSLWQEVDTDSDRSYHVNQLRMLETAFVDRAAVFAVNFHSGFLAYPFTDMHGRVNAGILALSDTTITSAVRRSYPIDESFPNKFFDLDRCFEVMRIPVSNGHDLVLINSHMSAYDEGGTIRAQQLAMITEYMSTEYAAGNYVIAGGDWNHALCGSVDMYESEQLVPDWVSTLDDSELPEHFSTVRADNLEEVASCRADDIPYEKGVTYTVTVDGFIVSDNVKATATNIDTGFAYSDHNPVKLSFSLAK